VAEPPRFDKPPVGWTQTYFALMRMTLIIAWGSMSMNAPFIPPRTLRPAVTNATERSAYDGARGFDPVSLTATLLIMAGLLAVLMTMAGHHRHRHHHHQRLVFDMLEMPRQPPPAPPAPQPKTIHKTPPRVSEIVAPVPHVTTPTPAPAVFVAETTAPPRLTPAAASAEPAPAAPPAPAPPAPTSVVDLSAKMLSAKPPSYPLESRRLREQGTVVLAVLLATNGRVEEISVAHSSGFERLDRAALGAVRSWRWSPLMRGGEAVMVRGMVTIPFVLRT